MEKRVEAMGHGVVWRIGSVLMIIWAVSGCSGSASPGSTGGVAEGAKGLIYGAGAGAAAGGIYGGIDGGMAGAVAGAGRGAATKTAEQVLGAGVRSLTPVGDAPAVPVGPAVPVAAAVPGVAPGAAVTPAASASSPSAPQGGPEWRVIRPSQRSAAEAGGSPAGSAGPKGSILACDEAFESGTARLTPSGESAIREVAKSLQRSGAAAAVFAHTDNRGSPESNRQLSTARAEVVAAALVKAGVKRSHVTAAGLGDSRPIASNETREGRARNRRVEIVVAEWQVGGVAAPVPARPATVVPDEPR